MEMTEEFFLHLLFHVNGRFLCKLGFVLEVFGALEVLSGSFWRLVSREVLCFFLGIGDKVFL